VRKSPVQVDGRDKASHLGKRQPYQYDHCLLHETSPFMRRISPGGSFS
jgi:hypothetical protein